MLPCMLPPDIPTAALDELVEYHRIKATSSNVCKDCMNEYEQKRKRCVSCGVIYTKDGVENDANAIKKLERTIAAMKQKQAREAEEEVG